jgi:hypothetical protein
MGGAAFQLLKRERNRLESSKQAEIRLASLRKILRIPRFGGPEGLAVCGQGHVPWLYLRGFPPGRGGLIVKTVALLPRSQFLL